VETFVYPTFEMHISKIDSHRMLNQTLISWNYLCCSP